MRRIILPAIALLVLAGPAVAQPPAKPEDTAWREAVGSLAGLNLYQTYLNIGLLADGKAEGVYEAKQARELLDSILKPIDDTTARLARLAKAAPKEDREALETAQRLYNLLQKQGKSLRAFWESGKKEDGDAYEAARKAAWEGIAKFLKLED